LVWLVRDGVLRVLLFTGVLVGGWLRGRGAGERLPSVFGIVVSCGCVLAILGSLWVVVARGLLWRVVRCLVIRRGSRLMCLLRLGRWRRERLGELRSLELRLLCRRPSKVQHGSPLLGCGLRAVVVWSWVLLTWVYLS
jgi:hypothetical protein